MRDEDHEQIALVAKVRRWNMTAETPLLFCHVPNGGLRDKRTALKLWEMGVEEGVPDLLFFNGPYVAIEMKRVKGGKLSKGQKVWAKRLAESGWLWFRCNGEAEAIAVLERIYGCHLTEQKLPSHIIVKSRS